MPALRPEGKYPLAIIIAANLNICQIKWSTFPLNEVLLNLLYINYLILHLIYFFHVLFNRSGLAWKNSIDVGAGVIDYDYRGNVGVILFNLSDVDFEVKRGDRVAQLILERISMADVQEVAELSDTSRGAGGFGSTGVSATATATSTAAADVKRAKTEGDL